MKRLILLLALCVVFSQATRSIAANMEEKVFLVGFYTTEQDQSTRKNWHSPVYLKNLSQFYPEFIRIRNENKCLRRFFDELYTVYKSPLFDNFRTRVAADKGLTRFLAEIDFGVDPSSTGGLACGTWQFYGRTAFDGHAQKVNLSEFVDPSTGAIAAEKMEAVFQKHYEDYLRARASAVSQKNAWTKTKDELFRASPLATRLVTDKLIDFTSKAGAPHFGFSVYLDDGDAQDSWSTDDEAGLHALNELLKSNSCFREVVDLTLDNFFESQLAQDAWAKVAAKDSLRKLEYSLVIRKEKPGSPYVPLCGIGTLGINTSTWGRICGYSAGTSTRSPKLYTPQIASRDIQRELEGMYKYKSECEAAHSYFKDQYEKYKSTAPFFSLIGDGVYL
jgi:hypothetical protein